MQTKLIKIIGIIGILALGGWWLLPRVITAVPSQIRYRLPEPLLALVTTPLPTALPAPAVNAPPPTIFVPTLPATAVATPTLAPTLPSTFTPAPTHEAATAVATALPSPTNTPSPTPSPTPTLPTTVFLEGIENVPQLFNNCGAANLTTVLTYYGQEVDQRDVAAVVRPDYDDRNVSPWQLASYVQTETALEADTYIGGDVELLKRLLAAGFPIIIEKGLVLEDHDGWMGHYLTLFGYEEASQQFWTLDTFLGPFDSVGRLESYEETMRYWRDFNYRFIVVYAPEQETAVHNILGSTYLDPLAMWQQAAERAQTAVNDSPADAFAWFNLGSSLTHLGELTGEATYYETAAVAFDEARRIGLPWRMLWYQFEPYEAYLGNGRAADVLALTDAMITSEGGRYVEETFFYQGNAWLAQGDLDRARRAYERALEVNPNFSPAQEALAANGE
ncbi:MAG: tetratricopeptide repeat protein [Ardenticatenaceae bacterium]|nr:tetratricopeptide repeat protein [Ardenticatenaceae bacterium]